MDLILSVIFMSVNIFPLASLYPVSESSHDHLTSAQNDGRPSLSNESASNKMLHPMRLMVTFKGKDNPSFLEKSLELEEHINSKPNVRYEHLKHTKSYVLEISGNLGKYELDEIINDIEKLGGVVEVDEVLTANSHSKMIYRRGSDTFKVESRLKYNKKQWYIPELRLPQAWGHIRKENLRDVKICIVDTGVDYTHDGLSKNIHVNEEEMSGSYSNDDDNNGYVDDVYGYNFVGDSSDPMDDNGHGTHVAGIIASNFVSSGVAGINPYAKIIACKAFDRNMKSRMSNTVKCINYCIEVGARIQNHSWAVFKEKEVIKAAFQAANDKGVLMVVSAGNNHFNEYDEDAIPHDMDKTVVIPAIYSRYYQNVLTIANLRQITKPAAANYIKRCLRKSRDPTLCHNKIIQLELNKTSMYGYSSVQIAVPGTKIFSLIPDNAYAFMDGTSMSTAIMSGICSLVLSLEGNHLKMSPKQVIQIIRECVRPIHSLTNKVRWEGTVDCKRVVTLSKLFVEAMESRFMSRLILDKQDFTDMQIEI